jgi:hypothetical protein
MEKWKPLEPVARVEVTRKGDHLLVRVTNVSRGDVSYGGYGPSSPRTFSEDQRGDRRVDENWMWCGTGLESYRLRPGGTVVFRFPVQSHTEGRVRDDAVFSDARGERKALVPLCEREGLKAVART